MDRTGKYSIELLGLCWWIACRANEVLCEVAKQKPPESPQEALESDGGWKAVGVVFYDGKVN